MDEETERLVNELGMSKEDAQTVLGITVNTSKSPEQLVHEMLPNVPLPIIKQMLEIHDGDVDKAIEELLSWTVLSDEQKQVENVQTRKQARAARRRERQFENRMREHASEVALFAHSAGIDEEEAAAVLADNGLSLSAALATRAKTILPNSDLRQQHRHVQMATKQLVAGVEIEDTKQLETRVNPFIGIDERRLQAMRESTKEQVAGAQLRYNERRRQANTPLLKDAYEECTRLKLELSQINAAIKDGELERTSGGTRTPTIDLHYCTVDEARVFMDLAVEKHLRRTNDELKVITGRGTHSTGGKSVLQPWLKQYLAQIPNLKTTHHDGYATVRRR